MIADELDQLLDAFTVYFPEVSVWLDKQTDDTVKAWRDSLGRLRFDAAMEARDQGQRTLVGVGVGQIKDGLGSERDRRDQADIPMERGSRKQGAGPLGRSRCCGRAGRSRGAAERHQTNRDRLH